MDRGVATRRVDDLKSIIEKQSLLVCKMTIALDLFDSGLNKGLQIKTEISFIKYFTRDNLAQELERNKAALEIITTRLRKAKTILNAYDVRESIKSGPRRV